MPAAQGAVIERATALMTSDVYALPPESPEWEARVGSRHRPGYTIVVR